LGLNETLRSKLIFPLGAHETFSPNEYKLFSKKAKFLMKKKTTKHGIKNIFKVMPQTVITL